MSKPQREIDDLLWRRLVLRHSFGPGLGAAAMWIMYAVNAVFHVDLMHLFSDPSTERMSPAGALIFAVAGSLICMVFAIVQTRKAIALARYGEEVEGTISKHGIAFRGLVRVECSYSVGNSDHVFVWSTAREVAPPVGESVVLLVDPTNPKRCMLIEDVFADRKRAKQVPVKRLRDRIFEVALFGFVVVGLAWVAWDRFHGAGAKPAPAAAKAGAAVNPPAAQPQTPVRPATKPPSKEILFQPMFVWEDCEPTYQGTGFFVKAPGDKVAAVTSIHFLDIAGPRLQEARWLNPANDEPVAALKRSWGPPGKAGVVHIIAGKDGDGKPLTIDLPMLDKRTDYLLMPASDGVPARVVLELDPRTTLEPNEPVYFHDKCAFDQKGYEILEGAVIRTAPEQYQVMLNQDIKPESQSGSPVISQATGKVIGIVAGMAGSDEGGTGILPGVGAGSPRMLVLTPSYSILKALEEGHDFPLLRDVIGKKPAGDSPAPSKTTGPGEPGH